MIARRPDPPRRTPGWITANATVPPVLAVASLVTLRNAESLSFGFWTALGVASLGLAIANLVVLPFRWRRIRARALVAPAVLVASFALGVALNFYGTNLMLAGTPARPDTWFTAPRRAELEDVAGRLLAGERTPSMDAILDREGFRRVEVDSVLGIVTLAHARLRTWFEYAWVPRGWPPDFTHAPLAPGAAARFATLRDATNGPLTDPRITVGTDGRSLLLDGLPSGLPGWATNLFASLVDRGVVNLAGDGRHLAIRGGLAEPERSQLAWLQLAVEGVLRPGLALPDHVFGRALGPRWYFRTL